MLFAGALEFATDLKKPTFAAPAPSPGVLRSQLPLQSRSALG
jgi:hypothetical protein